MKLVSLRVTGYRQFLDPTFLEFPDGLIGICGPNGVGKSKLVEAIGYALYGPDDSYILPDGDKAADIPSAASPGCTQQVELTFELRGQRYDVVRTARHASIKMHGTETPLGVGSREVGRVVAR